MNTRKKIAASAFAGLIALAVGVAPCAEGDSRGSAGGFRGGSVGGRGFSGGGFSGRSFSGRSFSGGGFSGRSFSGRSVSGPSFSSRGFSGHASSGHVSSGRGFSGHSSSGRISQSRGFSTRSSSGRVSSGQPSTSPAPPRGSFRGGDAIPRGGSYGGGQGSHGGHGGQGGWGGGYGGHGGHGGHGGGYYGGSYHGGHYYGGHYYPHWYSGWYWGCAPYYWGMGWLWGWPGYWDPWWGGYGYSPVWGPGPYYSDVYSWRSTHTAWASRFGRVKTEVSPDETELYLAGRYIGSADDFDGFPDYLYLEPGSYKLEFRLPGYQTWVAEVTVRRGEALKLDHEMALAPGKSRLSSFFPESKGTPEGRFFGADGKAVAPEALRRAQEDAEDEGDEPADIDAPKPRTDVQARPDSMGRGGGAVEAPPEREERIDRPAEGVPPSEIPDRARIRWDVTPEDAGVWIDDEYAGTGNELSTRPRGTYTTPGKHSVSVIRPGYRTKTITVETRSGEAVDVVVALEK